VRIVVVEDETKPRYGLVHLLGRLDPSYCVVGQARNGREGKEIIEQLAPDLVITDIKMPEMDGLDMIRALRSEGCAATFVILSGYAEFEYAKQGIVLGVRDYLLKPVSPQDIQELLKKVAGGGTTFSPAPPQPLQLAGGVLLLFYFNKTAPSSRKVLTLLVQRCAERARGAGCTLVEHPDDASYLFHVGCPLPLEELVSILEGEMSLMREQLLHVGMSCAACAIPPGGDPHALLPPLRALLKWSMLVEPLIVIHAGMTSRTPCTQPEYPVTIEGRVLEALRAGDPVLIESTIREFRTFCLAPTYSPPRLEEIAFRFLFTVANFIKEIDYVRFRSVVSRNLLQRIEGFRSGPELSDIIDDFLSCATSGVAPHPVDAYSVPVRQTLNYIRTGYRGKISLDEAAVRIGITPEYLSSLFLKETGTHFTSFVIECRINEAKRLLAAGNARVFEIAEAVGISDPRYFCRVFKKQTGLSPREYAHLHP
jgi:two-component system response regulator YesN